MRDRGCKVAFQIATAASLFAGLPAFSDTFTPVVVPIAVTGQVPPDLPGHAIDSLIGSPVISNSGQISFPAAVDGDPYSHSTFVGTPGAFSLVSEAGTHAAGFPADATVGPMSVAGFDASGRMLAEAYVRSPSIPTTPYLWIGQPKSLAPIAPSGAPVGSQFITVVSISAFTRNDQVLVWNPGTGLYAGTPDSMTSLALKGDQAPGLPDGFKFTAINGISSINSHGQAAFTGTVSGAGVLNGQQGGAWFGTPGSLQLLTFAPPVPPAAPAGLDTFQVSNLSINDAGKVAFSANWIKGFSGTPVASPPSIYAGTPGSLKLIASNASSPILTSSGDVLFSSSGSLYRSTPSGLQVLVQTGSQAPGLPAGSYFTSVAPVEVNRRGQYLVYGDFGQKSGLWGGSGGQLYLIAYEGESINLANGLTGTLSGINLLTGSNGEDGRKLTLNDLGQVVFNAYVGKLGTTTTQTADFFAQLPIPGDANLNGIVDSEDVKILNNNLGKSGDLAHGDFNDDGWVDFRDFQILEQDYGRAIQTFGAAGSLALSQNVPEPANFILVGVIATLLVRRAR